MLPFIASTARAEILQSYHLFQDYHYKHLHVQVRHSNLKCYIMMHFNGKLHYFEEQLACDSIKDVYVLFSLALAGKLV